MDGNWKDWDTVKHPQPIVEHYFYCGQRETAGKPLLVELTQKYLDILSIKYIHFFPLQVKFEIYDSDGNSKNLNKKDYMGKKEVNLDTIVQQKR